MGGGKVDQLGISGFKEQYNSDFPGFFFFASKTKLGVEAASNPKMPKATDKINFNKIRKLSFSI